MNAMTNTIEPHSQAIILFRNQLIVIHVIINILIHKICQTNAFVPFDAYAIRNAVFWTELGETHWYILYIIYTNVNAIRIYVVICQLHHPYNEFRCSIDSQYSLIYSMFLIIYSHLLRWHSNASCATNCAHDFKIYAVVVKCNWI